MEIHISNEVLERVFFNDGSLRDIYVLHVDIDDWQKILNWIRHSHWDVVFYENGQITVNKGKDVSYFFEEENKSFLMSIGIEGVKINCQFFSEDEIELDIDPREVKSVSEAKSVFEFMINLSNILGKESILTEENSPEFPLVTVHSDGTLIIGAC